MTNESRKLTISSKAVNGLLLGGLILVMGAGAFAFIKSRPAAEKPTPATNAPPTVSAPSDEVDTSKWKLFRSPELGFEMRLPPQWPNLNVFVGDRIPDDTGWEDSVGSAYYNQEFEIRVKKSDLTLQEFNISTSGDFPDNLEVEVKDGDQILRNSIDNYTADYTNGYWFWEKILIKHGDVFYRIDLHNDGGSNEKQDITHTKEMRAAVSTFKSIPISK